MPSGVGSAARLAQDILGGPSRAALTTATVQTTVAQLVNNRADRIALVIQNLGNNAVHVGFGPGLTTSSGIRINPGGGSIGMVVRDDGELVSREFWAIADGGSSAVSVLETIVEARDGESQ